MNKICSIEIIDGLFKIKEKDFNDYDYDFADIDKFGIPKPKSTSHNVAFIRK